MPTYSVNLRERTDEINGPDSSWVVQRLTLGPTSLLAGDILRFFTAQPNRRLVDYWIGASQNLDAGTGLQFSVGLSNPNIDGLGSDSDVFGTGLTFGQLNGSIYRPTNCNHVITTPRTAPREVILVCTQAAQTYAGNGKHIYFAGLWIPA